MGHDDKNERMSPDEWFDANGYRYDSMRDIVRAAVEYAVSPAEQRATGADWDRFDPALGAPRSAEPLSIAVLRGVSNLLRRCLTHGLLRAETEAMLLDIEAALAVAPTSSERAQEPPLDMIEAAMAVEIDHVRMRRDDGRCVLGFDNAQKVLRAALAVTPNSASESQLRRALEESVKLQSHYASLLNMHDGGERMTFTADSWIERLEFLARSEGRGA